MIEEPFAIKRPGYDLAGLLHLPEACPSRGLVIVTHGLFASMASPKHARICRAMTGAGLAAARFDCLGCGLTGGSVAETTLRGRIGEIKAVKEHLAADPRIDGPIILIGSSFGGSASLLAAAEEDWTAGVIAWSSPIDFAPLAKEWQRGLEREMAPAFYDDLRKIDLPEKIRGLAPVLLIHGEDDETIPVGQAIAGLGQLGAPARLVIIDRADHRLSTLGALDMALAETMAFLAAEMGIAPAASGITGR